MSKPVSKKRTGKPTLYSIAWTHPLTQKSHKLNIRHTRDYLVAGTDHIEIISASAKQPNPLTETGYRSHFMDPLELVNAGGAVSFVTAWLQRELKSAVWLKAESKRAQGDLFQWADAQTAVTARKGRDQRTPPRPAIKRAAIKKKDRTP